MIKNCVIIGPAYPLRGGIADLNESLARTFQDKGINTTLYSFSFQYPSFLFPGKTQLREGGKAPADLNIKTVIHSMLPWNWYKSARQIAKEKPDVVFVRYWIPVLAPALGVICARLKRKGIPVVCIADNVIPHESWIGGHQLNSFFINKVEAFLLMSKSVENDLLNYRSDVLHKRAPHPVYNVFGDLVEKSSAQAKLGLDPSKKWILFFGFIRKYKGLKLLLESIADQRLQDINLVVAGEFYDDPKEYTDLIGELGLQDRVKLFSSFIPAEEVGLYFCAADIVVQPYLSATQSGITQIAYNFNRPMLVTDVGGLSEWIPETVGYVVDVNKDAICTALKDFYNNNREEAMSKAASKQKELYSWTHFADQLLSLAEELKQRKFAK